MSTAKSLTEEQISTIRQWAEDGAELSDVQKKLADELEIKVTYLETRFLLEDLGIELIPAEDPKPAEDEESSDEISSDAEEDAVQPEDAPPSEGGVSVTVDTVLRPGALISGRAVFEGGQSAAWWLDQMGRLGMDPAEPDFRPSEDQMRAFQMELQRTIQESGM